MGLNRAFKVCLDIRMVHVYLCSNSWKVSPAFDLPLIFGFLIYCILVNANKKEKEKFNLKKLKITYSVVWCGVV